MNTFKKNFLKFLIILLSFGYLKSDKDFSFFVEDEEGRIIDLFKLSDRSIVICFHYYCCMDCFKIITKLRVDFPNYYFYILARAEKNDLFNKRKVKLFIRRNFKKYLQEDTSVFFDIHKEKDPWPPANLKEGIFAKYKITKTPAYFILTKDTLIFVPYEQIERELYK